ncbi:Kiwa anti-phage protein KwaB-like domain-containing protein [Microbacterium sp. CJ88]|uniref:Kiwa anti-phage protein KwaB-like domain-containing protein n=1 Tax=Microbacterium sp. CJ88 TaxID=3445672 RepID=UPI003F65FC9C
MSRDDRREHLAAQIAQIRLDPALTTYVVRGASLSSATVTRITLERDLTATVVADVLAHAERISEKEFLPYDPSYQLASNQVIADDVAEVPAIAELLAVVDRDDVATDAGGDPVIAMVHRVEGAGEASVTVLRLTGAGIATKRARGVRALLGQGGVFTEIDAEILYYEPRFDALVSGGDLIVSTITLLSRKLEAPERARARAREVFSTATERIAIRGADELADAVASDPAMIAKMMAVSRLLEHDPDYAELLTTDRLVPFLRANPHIDIDIVGEGDAAQLVYDPAPQKRYRIVKALADDYLSSQLTGRDYEAGSKQRL